MATTVCNNGYRLRPMKFGERLEAAMLEMKWGPIDLFNRTGVADSTISALVRRNSDKSSYQERIIKGFPEDLISHAWLRDGTGTMRPTVLSPPPGVGSRDFLTGRLAVVGTAQLGDDGYFCELEYPAGHGDGYIRWASNDAHAYGLRCKGDSMKPRIRHGEYVIIEPTREAMPGDEVMVISKDGRVMVKQLAFVRDGMIYLDSVNESFPRISLPQDQVEKMQYVAGIAKRDLWSQD